MAQPVAIQSPSTLNQYAKWGLFGLGLQFVLGTVVAMWQIPPAEETATHKSPLFASLSFDLHMILALILLGWSIFLLVKLRQSHNPAEKLGRACMGSIAGAIVGGTSIFWAPENWVPVGLFIMGMGFLGAFVNYWRLYIATKS